MTAAGTAIAVPEAFAQALRELGLAGAAPLSGVPLTSTIMMPCAPNA